MRPARSAGPTQCILYRPVPTCHLASTPPELVPLALPAHFCQTLLMFAWLRSFLGLTPAAPQDVDLSKAPDEHVPEERLPETRPEHREPWIGVDLDGTLAESGRWLSMSHIGPPVPLMLRRVKAWLEKGLRVKIMTARAGSEEGLAATKQWLTDNGLPNLEVTDKKDFDMIELWDDRAIQVVHNTGMCFLGTSYFARPQAPILTNEAADRTFILVGSEKPKTEHDKK